MSLAVAWTPEAQETFDDTIIQIESKWELVLQKNL